MHLAFRHTVYLFSNTGPSFLISPIPQRNGNNSDLPINEVTDFYDSTVSLQYKHPVLLSWTLNQVSEHSKRSFWKDCLFRQDGHILLPFLTIPLPFSKMVFVYLGSDMGVSQRCPQWDFTVGRVEQLSHYSSGIFLRRCPLSGSLCDVRPIAICT